MNIRIDDRWRVRAEHAVDVPMAVSAVWGQVKDLQHFLAFDPLHTSIECVPPADGNWLGVELGIPHRLMGMGPDRHGRVLVWREHREVVFSDLSRRGNDRGFPHVCGVRLEAIGETACRVVVFARGKWTAKRVPRWLVKMWIAWVLGATGMRLSSELGEVARRRARATTSSAS